MFPRNSILATTDLTEECEPALRAASDLAIRSGAALHILHAFELRGNPYAERPAARSAFQALVKEAEDGLAEQVRRTVAPGVDLRSVSSELYLPWKAIVQKAKEVAAELVILGPHEHVAGDRFLGSTADRVIRFADAPCLIVRRGRGFEVTRIVLAIDGSAATNAAWQEAVLWASELATEKVGELHIVHCAPDMVEAIAGQDLIDGALRDAHAHLQERVSVTGAVLRGEDAASEIVGYADRVGADLIVLASSGHRTLDRVITGSTTSSVALHSACPLLVVPIRDTATNFPALEKAETRHVAEVDT